MFVCVFCVWVCMCMCMCVCVSVSECFCKRLKESKVKSQTINKGRNLLGEIWTCHFLSKAKLLLNFVCLCFYFNACTTHLDNRMGNALAYKQAQFINKKLHYQGFAIQVLVVWWMFLCWCLLSSLIIFSCL